MARSPVLTNTIIVVAFAVLSSSRVDAQTSRTPSRSGPFSQLELSLSGSARQAGTELSPLWQPGAGAGIALATPFYAGWLVAGVDYAPFDPIGNDSGRARRPTFIALILHLGWNIRMAIAGPLRVEAGMDVGNFFMAFDENAIRGVRNESEFSAAVHAGPRIRLSKHIGLFALVGVRRVFTAIPTDLVSLSAGISIRFRTPGWLQRMLE